MQILGTRIDSYTPKERDARVRSFLLASRGEAAQIVTPNPEMLVEAYQDAAFQTVLNKSDLSLCDGFGIRVMARTHIHRVTGTDFLLALAKIAAEEEKTIFLLGSEDEVVAQKAAAYIEKKTRVTIVGTHPGIALRWNEKGVLVYDAEEHVLMLAQIKQTNPDILCVAFGHKKQETWMDQHKEMFPSVKLMMGVGGAFDFYGGKVKRAPLMMRRLGIEWLWRLIQEPWRIRRICRAVLVFPVLVIKERLFAPDKKKQKD